MVNKFKSTSGIDGWLYKVDIEIMTVLANAQAELNVRGDLGEIGVHHGKSFITLHQLFRPEKSLLIDLFDQQIYNIDKSGDGDLEILRKNIQKYSIDESTLEILKTNSFDVTPEQIFNRNMEFLIAHIDGAHYFEAVKNDMELFALCLSKGGILVLDDYARGEWPDVSAAFWDVYHNKNYNLAIIAFGQNKLFLTQKGDEKHYRDALIKNRKTTHLITKYHTLDNRNIPVFQLFPSERWGVVRWVNYLLHLYSPFFASLFRRVYRGVKSVRKNKEN